MIIISYYTKDSPYEEVMKTHLLPSLQKFGLDYDIEGIEDLGDWQKNTHYKAKFIKEMLLKHKCSVVFLDADATIEQYPKLFSYLYKYDISYHELDWTLQWRSSAGTRKEILSGTLYLNYNEKILHFLDEWIKENNKSLTWEQKNMQEVLKRKTIDLKAYPLPYEYIVIPRHNGQIPPHIKKEDVVILHHQKSREYKHWRRK